jgi:hypothetical protein
MTLGQNVQLGRYATTIVRWRGDVDRDRSLVRDVADHRSGNPLQTHPPTSAHYHHPSQQSSSAIAGALGVQCTLLMRGSPCSNLRSAFTVTARPLDDVSVASTR